MSRPIALLSALGAGFALYKRSDGVAVGLALVTYVSLRSIESSSARVKRAPALRGRSLSLPNLKLLKANSRVQSLQMTSSRPPLQPMESLPPPPPHEEKRVRVDQLPILELSFWSCWTGPPTSSHIIVFNARFREVGSSLLDWDSLLGTEPLSLEVGNIWGGIERAKREGGRWLFMTNSFYHLSHVVRFDQLSLFGDPWLEPGALPKGRFRRIDLRFQEIDDRIAHLFDLLEEGGEFRCIYHRSNLSGQVKCEEKMGSPNRRLVVPPSELHLIYGKERGEIQPELIKLSQLPQTRSYLWWLNDSFPASLEVVNGIVDLRASGSIALDWDELFPESEPLSLELGDVFGSAQRTLNRGGNWAVMTHWLQGAASARGARQGGLTQPLVLLGNHWSHPSFLPKGRFNQIHFRLIHAGIPDYPLSCDQIVCFAEALGEGGELWLIFDQGEPKIDEYQRKIESSGRFDFLRSEEVQETIVMVDLGWFRRTKGSIQTHLIYRKVR